MRLSLPARIGLVILIAFLPPLASALPAQMPPLTVPKGKFRFDVWGEFRDSDQRFFQGQRQELAQDFTTPALGSATIPFLRDAEARMAGLGASGFRFNLGATEASSLVNIGTTGIGLAMGITDRLTLFGAVPIVRVRVQPRVQFDSTGGNAGFNPADPVFGTAPGRDAATQFFDGFDATLDTLAQRIGSGFYDASGQRALAEATLASGTALRNGLRGLLTDSATASRLLPLAGSGSAAALTGPIATFQATVTGTLGLPEFTGSPLFPAAPLSSEEFANLVTNGAGPIASPFFEDVPTTTKIGDVELGLTYVLAERTPTDKGGLALRATGIGLVRLPTGTVASSDVLFGVGSGDSQLDTELTLVGDAVASWWGIRVSGTYNRQFASTVTRRIASPEEAFASASSTASVRHDPGDIVSFRASPFLRLAPSLALHAGLRYWNRGDDTFTLDAGQDPAAFPDPAVLGQDSGASATSFLGGLSFAHSGIGRRGDTSLPMDASLEFERILSSSGGRVRDDRILRARIRLYGRSPL